MVSVESPTLLTDLLSFGRLTRALGKRRIHSSAGGATEPSPPRERWVSEGDCMFFLRITFQSFLDACWANSLQRIMTSFWRQATSPSRRIFDVSAGARHSQITEHPAIVCCRKVLNSRPGFTQWSVQSLELADEATAKQQNCNFEGPSRNGGPQRWSEKERQGRCCLAGPSGRRFV